MIHTVQKFIETHRLLSDDLPVLVGVSGGADSVALLALLHRLGYSCVAAHCNFHLRGEESDRDEQFTRALCEGWGIPCRVIDFDTVTYASSRHLSIEMAARELRYDWFEQLRKEYHAQAIAVAHHRDDSVETLLLNLIRGTGIRGMRGIRPKNGKVVRPLLSVSREEIVQWLESQQLTYMTDSTNLTDAYTRNYIRLRLLPMMEELNPSVKATLARSADHLAAAENIYDHVVNQAKTELIKNNTEIAIPALLGYPSPETILYELLKDYGFSPIVSQEIFRSLEGISGKMFYSPTHRLIKDRDRLFISPLSAIHKGEAITFNPFDGADEQLPIPLSFSLEDITSHFQLIKDPSVATFDYDTLQFPLTLRRWQEGDWFVPFGMRGRKKLSDFFQDIKCSVVDKEDIWLLCSGEKIIWVVGYRSDDRFRIHKGSKRALIVKKTEKTMRSIK